MRQLTTPARLAELAVTVVVLAASAGCMSVSEDAGRPKPSVSAGQHGGTATSDEGKGGPGEGRERTGKRDPKAPGGASGTPSAGGSPGASGSAAPSAGAHPKPGGPGPAKPTPGGPSHPAPSASQSVPVPPPVSPPPPPASPTPPPPASPSTTPGADTHTSALRRNQAPIDQEPTASPQVGPV
ncbi:hypothetical protein [Streptomyces sp. NPDC048111]|uniref:hypothetical protein n=1 Tax=Streptomyces sp. NPDC048111 TaxID=3365500 RepID=UPI00371EC7A8